MTSKRQAAWLILDLLVWGLIFYLLIRPYDPFTRARVCWRATRVCWATAAWFGEWAIAAERRYFTEMENAL